jgi:hypothetical protein
MLDPTVSFLIFALLIPLVLLGLKGAKVILSPTARQVVAGVLALGAAALQVWVMGTFPVFEGDALAILKVAVAFFSGQMALYEVVYKRIFALFEA